MEFITDRDVRYGLFLGETAVMTSLVGGFDLGKPGFEAG
jgi:hypothetical protein